MSERFRRILVVTLGVVSLSALLLGTTYTYLARSFFDDEIFATRVADGLLDPAFSGVVAELLTDQVIALNSDLLPFRPIILTSVENVVRSAPFRTVAEKAVKETHQTLLSESGAGITLAIQDAGVVVRDALSIHPEIAEKVPAKALVVIVDAADWPTGKILAEVMRIANRSRTRALAILGLSLLSGAMALGFTGRKQEYLLRYGLAMAIVGVVMGALSRFGGPLFAAMADSEIMFRLIRGLWAAFIEPLALRMWILAGIGLVVVAGVASIFSRVDLAMLATRARSRLGSRPSRASRGLARGAIFAVVGGVAALHPTLAIQILTTVGASVLFFFGIQEVFLAIMSWLPGVEPAGTVAAGGARAHPSRIVAATIIGMVVISAGVLWYMNEDRAPMSSSVVDACNGHPELCDRRLDEVALAATHNSMSAGDIPDWMFPNQERSIRRQLQDGVRGFLLDVHYAVPVGNRVKTVMEDTAASRAKYEQVLGKEAVDAAMRIRDLMVGEETGDRGIYLCHGFCELGARPFVDTLETFYEFLVMHPGEVIVIIIQDEGVTPQDVATCFEKSGLERLVYRGQVTAPWPTLREMVESDQRVVVFGEHDTEGVPWYHPAFEAYQETPYRALNPSEFSNEPGRGGTSGSLLLMNHWIETGATPLPRNAQIVNAYDFLLARARACGNERGMIPNLVAVDFYRRGDLIRVVDTLNGIEPPTTTVLDGGQRR